METNKKNASIVFDYNDEDKNLIQQLLNTQQMEHFIQHSILIPSNLPFKKLSNSDVIKEWLKLNNVPNEIINWICNEYYKQHPNELVNELDKFVDDPRKFVINLWKFVATKIYCSDKNESKIDKKTVNALIKKQKNWVEKQFLIDKASEQKKLNVKELETISSIAERTRATRKMYKGVNQDIFENFRKIQDRQPTHLDKLIAERDYKRRRKSYKKNVKRTPTIITREIINEYMEYLQRIYKY